MASNIQDLTRGWIKYLKNNRIAKMNSDPKTGKLLYNKQPSVQNLIKYLRITDEFDDDAIRNAILQVVKSKKGGPGAPDDKSLPSGSEKQPDSQQSLPKPGVNAPTQPQGQKALPGKNPSGDVSTWHHTEMTPGQRQEPGSDVAQTPQRQPKKSRFNTDDAEDAEVKSPRQNPPRLQGNGNAPRLGGPAQPEEPPQPPPRKPRFKYRNKIREALYDDDGTEVTEEEAEAVFRILLGGQGKQSAENKPGQEQTGQEQPGQEQPAQAEDPEKVKERKQQTLRELKQMIREAMSPAQRKALWRALSEA